MIKKHDVEIVKYRYSDGKPYWKVRWCSSADWMGIDWTDAGLAGSEEEAEELADKVRENLKL